MLNVYIYKVNNKVDMVDLPKVVIDHVNRYTNKQAKALSAFAWAKTCDLLADYDFNFKSLSFKEDQPYITKSKIFFNISHTDKYVAIAISDCPVGIDIQKKLTKKQEQALVFAQMIDKDSKENATAVFTEFEAWYKMNHFMKKVKAAKKGFNTIGLEIEKQLFVLSVINEKDDKITFNELEYGLLKVKMNKI